MNDRELAVAYLLDELDPGERAALERRLGEDPELRREVESLRSIVADLESLPAEAWPPEIAPEPQPASHPEPTQRRWTVRPAAALASLLAVAAIGLGLGLLLDDGGGSGSREEPLIVLTPLRPTTGEQATVAMPKADEMVFRAEGLPDPGAGHYYELWLMSDAQRTLPVASFRAAADGTAVVRVLLPADPSAYRYFDVSLQKVGGGTGHSAVSVLRGSTS